MSDRNWAKNSTSTQREELEYSSYMRYFLHNFIKSLKKYFVWVILISVVVAAVVYAVNKLNYKPRYESSVTFLAMPVLSTSSNNQNDVYRVSSSLILGSQLSSTFPHIFESGVLKEIIQNELGGPIDATIKASSAAGTNFFKITVNSNTPENAKNIADLLMKNYPKVSENVIGVIKTEIKIPAKLPTRPSNSSDNTTKAALAFGLSAVIGVVIIGIFAANRKTVCNKEDVKYTLNQPYICEVPLVNDKKKYANRFKAVIRSKSFVEAIRTLKNRTLSTITENQYQTIGVVSTSDMEGKTTIGAGFARIMSDRTNPVVFVTFDRENALDYVKTKKNKAFEKTTMSLMMSITSEKPSPAVEGIRKLFTNVDILVLPPEIIRDKDRLDDIFTVLKENYKYVIVDIVPGEGHSEAVTFANICDAYISVIRCDFASVKKIRNTLNYFSYSQAHNLGVVLNGVSGLYVAYGRYNGYDKYRKYSYGYNYNYYAYGQYGADPNSGSQSE